MSHQNAKDAARAWIEAAALPLDLRGRVLDLVTFASEEDCRYFYPRRALIWQQMVNTAIVKALRARKVELHRVIVTRAEYDAWRGTRPDSEDLRRDYADGRVGLQPEA